MLEVVRQKYYSARWSCFKSNDLRFDGDGTNSEGAFSIHNKVADNVLRKMEAI